MKEFKLYFLFQKIMSTSDFVAQSSQPVLPTQNVELEAPLQSSRQNTDPAWEK
jgi:hypothetical protein